MPDRTFRAIQTLTARMIATWWLDRQRRQHRHIHSVRNVGETAIDELSWLRAMIGGADLDVLAEGGSAGGEGRATGESSW
ncbi:hypothetical protein [Nonomuraea ferruginea]|uniref:hypothetical protein n=1 Tax=Nonomuraea ferruginea TaxID=46174 RepID=UPI0033806A0E